MSGGGVPGQSGDEDGNAGALRVPACPRHCGDSGGRELPSPMVRPMQHAGSTAVFELRCARVPPVQGLPGDQHVASGAPWVGEVSFLHNHHSVEDMPVHKVHPHCRPRCHSSRSPRHRTFPRSYLRREGYPVSLGSNPRGCCAPLPPFLHRPTVLSHQMTRQGSCRQHLFALAASHLSL